MDNKETASLGFPSMQEQDVRGKHVLIRVDINSPIDQKTGRIVNENRLDKSIPTLRWLLKREARLAIMAHQGDTLDYENLISLDEHAQKLSAKLGRPVRYIDDVCGPSAQAAIKALLPGQALLLGNLRYLTEEVSSFENTVKLEAAQMQNTWLLRRLAPLFDLYINDAFAAAHRNAPSMVAFQERLPSAAGFLFFDEVSALSRVMTQPARPAVFVLGGAKISDAFGMLGKVLADSSADRILSCGLTGEIFLMAAGYSLGAKKRKFIKDRGLDSFLGPATDFLKKYQDKIFMPVDLAFESEGRRQELPITALPQDEIFLDVGRKTVEIYTEEITRAGTVFVNGPAGAYENPLFEEGTREIWKSIASAPGFTVLGGGDTVTAATRFTDLDNIDYVCTAGGAMVRFLSGSKLPLIEAMKKARRKSL